MAILEVQQTVGLPAAALHSSIDKALYECRRAVLEADPQQPDQEIFVQPKEAQGRHDEVLRYDHLRTSIPKDQSQLLTHPGQKELKESWVVLEEGCPGEWLEAAQRSPGQLVLHRLSFCCCRAVGSWMARSSSCLAADD